jgi:nucleoside 2-deoxyribosyltransferase
MTITYDIYLAGPFFNEEQIATIAAVEKFLEEHQFKFYSPRRSGIVFKDLKPEEREAAAEQVFKANVDNIDDSTFILACIDDRDTGTAWELGYAYGSGDQNIITFSGKGYGANVMLSQCAKAHLTTLADLFDFLLNYRDNGFSPETIKDVSKPETDE